MSAGSGPLSDGGAQLSPDRAPGVVALLLATGGVLLALALSALILLVFFAFSAELSRDRAAASGADISPRTIPAGELLMRAGGEAATAGTARKILALAADGRAIVTAATDVLASDYPVVEYRISGQAPGVFIYLIWRTQEQPGLVFNASLYFRGDGAAALRLADNPEWKGTITELGLDIYGEPGASELLVHQLTLLPASALALSRVALSEWLVAERWSQFSINNLRGTPAGALYTPSVVIALWVAIAAFLALAVRQFAPATPAIPLLPLGLAGWLVLDFLWSSRLSAQLTETQSLFAGKSQQEKQLADMDGGLFRYALRLRQTVLPQEPATVFLLSESRGHDYHRLRMQYHLLPHSVHNFGQFPPTSQMRPGDYILVLGPVAGLVYYKWEQLLRWEGLNLRALRIDESPRGVLYQVGAPAGE